MGSMGSAIQACRVRVHRFASAGFVDSACQGFSAKTRSKPEGIEYPEDIGVSHRFDMLCTYHYPVVLKGAKELPRVSHRLFH